MMSSTADLLEPLARCTLFATLNREALRPLAERAEVVEVADGALLAREGERAGALLVVLEGRVDLVPGGAEGREAEAAAGSGSEPGTAPRAPVRAAAPALSAGPGDALGELQIVSGGRYPASALARGRGRVLRVPAREVLELAERSPGLLAHMAELVVRRLRRARLAEMLEGVFGALDPPVAEAVESAVEWVSLRRGERLFAEGDPGDALYFLLRGRLEVRVAGGGPPPGRLVHEVGPGAALGEIALVSDGRRSASVGAARECVLARLPRETFDVLSERHPALLRGVARALAERVKRKDEEARRPPRARTVSTVAVVPEGGGVPLERFVERLAAALVAHGPTAVIGSELVATYLGADTPDGADPAPGDPREARLRAWLEEQESAHRVTLYVADPAPTAWSRRAVRSADRVLLVDAAGERPARAGLERALLDGLDAQEAATLRRERVLLLADGARPPRGDRARREGRARERTHHVRLGREGEGDLARLARSLAGPSTDAGLADRLAGSPGARGAAAMVGRPAGVAAAGDGASASDTDRTLPSARARGLLERGRRTPHLLVVVGGSAGRLVRLDRASVTLGRAPSCDVRLDDEGISREHARIERDAAGAFEVVDAGSKNGCWYDGERVARRRLRDGDKVQLGPACVVKLTYQDGLDEAFQREQYERATRCGLTGALRREYFAQELERDFAFAARHGELEGLLLLDIDHFKRVNDTFGHAAGDMVLRRLVEVVHGALRAEDVLARLGGEEFGVLLRRQPREACLGIARRIRETVAATEFVFEGRRIPVTVSIGVASLEDGHYPTPADFLAAADRRLYAAKRGGRDRVVGEDGG